MANKSGKVIAIIDSDGEETLDFNRDNFSDIRCVVLEHTDHYDTYYFGEGMFNQETIH